MMAYYDKPEKRLELPRHDPNFEVPDEDGTVTCHGCGGPIEIADFVIWHGREFHRRCLPEEAEAATEVK